MCFFLEKGGGLEEGGLKIASEGREADDGKRLPAMDVVEPCVTLWKREEVWRRGGSRSTRVGGMRIPFSCFFGVVFWFVFGNRFFQFFLSFCRFWGVPGASFFATFLNILWFLHEKVEPSFLHTLTTFLLDFQGLGPSKIAQKNEKRHSENSRLLGCKKVCTKSVF